MKQVAFYGAWLTLAFNYFGLGITLTGFEFSTSELPWFLPFVTGGLNYGLTLYLSVNFDNKSWRTVTIGLCGLTWLFPPLLFTFFGIPFLLVYLIFALQLLTNGQLRTKINAR